MILDGSLNNHCIEALLEDHWKIMKGSYLDSQRIFGGHLEYLGRIIEGFQVDLQSIILRIVRGLLEDRGRIVRGSWEDLGSIVGGSRKNRRFLGGSLDDPWRILGGSLENHYKIVCTIVGGSCRDLGRNVGRSWETRHFMNLVNGSIIFKPV